MRVAPSPASPALPEPLQPLTQWQRAMHDDPDAGPYWQASVAFTRGYRLGYAAAAPELEKLRVLLVRTLLFMRPMHLGDNPGSWVAKELREDIENALDDAVETAASTPGGGATI